MLNVYRTTRIETADNLILVESEHIGVEAADNVKVTIDGGDAHMLSRLTVGALLEALRDHV